MASLLEHAHAFSILNAMNILQHQSDMAQLQAPLPLAMNGNNSILNDADFIIALNNGPFATVPLPPRPPQQQSLPYPSSLQNVPQFPQFLPDEEVMRVSIPPQRFLSNPCTRLGPSALSHASLWVSPTTGEFDHLLYNYLLMVTVDRRAATAGLIQRLPSLLSPQPSAGVNPNAAPFRASSSSLTDQNNITWSTGSAGSSTPSRREPRRGNSQSSEDSSSSNDQNRKIVQDHSPLSRDPSP